MSPIVILINGFAGVGKLTVARELAKLLDDARVFDNHLLIDPTAALYERDDPGYLPMREALRKVVFDSLATHSTEVQPGRTPPVVVFTEQRGTSNPAARAVLDEYLAFAALSSVRLYHVILHCSEEENLSRLVHADRAGGGTTKLVDPAILLQMRRDESFERLGDVEGLRGELEVDTSGLRAEMVAGIIRDYFAEELGPE